MVRRPGRHRHLPEAVNLLSPMMVMLLLMLVASGPARVLVEGLKTSITYEKETARSENELSHLPTEALDMLKSREMTLPSSFYQFTGIATGRQLLPQAARFATFPADSTCQCQHRCLAELRCLGFEFDWAAGSCALTDVLLRAGESRLSVDGWSGGRRRGVSWLDQPCASDAECRLLVAGGAHCSHQEAGLPGSCQCGPGWRPDGPLVCQRDGGRWVPLTSTLLVGQPLRRQQQPTLAECQRACSRAVDCWAVEFSAGQCVQWPAAEQQPSVEPLPAVTSYVWQFDGDDGSPPEGYDNLAGSWLRLSETAVPGKDAARACLRVHGIHYAPRQTDELQTVSKTFEAQEVTSFGVGISMHAEKGRFVTVDGDEFSTSSAFWYPSQPDNGNDEDCVASGFGGWTLHDVSCELAMPQLCEFVGDDLLAEAPAPLQHPATSSGEQTAWWSYDLGARRLVTRLLYVAGAQTGDVLWTELRVGSRPDDWADAPLCHRQLGTFVAAGFSRRFTCHVPLAGRYVHVRQVNNLDQPQWRNISAFGTRYEDWM